MGRCRLRDFRKKATELASFKLYMCEVNFRESQVMPLIIFG